MVSDMEKMLRDWVDAENSQDVDKFTSFYADDCVWEDVALGLVNRGKKEVKAYFKTMFVAVPDLRFEVQSVFVEGDWGVCEWLMTGTQAGDFPGLPSAVGKSFSVRGVSVIQLQNGKISRNSDYWNMATLLQQVGLYKPMNT